MELDYALLADSAQIAEGKTYILGSGVSMIWVNQYPAPLPVVLVVQFTYERAEADTDHTIRILVVDADGHPLLPEIHGEMHVGSPGPDIPRNIPLVAPLIVGFPSLPVIQRPGEYAVDILLDNRHMKRLPFAVAPPPQPPQA